MTLAAMAAAGLIAGLVFNAYALLVFCLVIISAGLATSLALGFTQAGFSIWLGPILFQLGYCAGLLLKGLNSSPRPASTHQIRPED